MKYLKSLSNYTIIFWVIISLFLSILFWSIFFELNKSINVTGTFKPLGKPVVIQNRFEGKVAKIMTGSGRLIQRNQEAVEFVKEIDAGEFRQVLGKIKEVEILIRRLTSQTKLEKNLKFQRKFDRTIFAEQNKLLMTEIAALETELDLISREKNLKTSSIKSNKLLQVSLEKELDLVRSKLKLTRELVEKKFEGTLSLLEIESNFVKLQNQIKEINVQNGLLRDEVRILEKKLSFTRENFVKDTLSKMVEAQQELRALLIKKSSLEEKIQEFSIRSPVDGIVSSLFAKNEGQIFKPGETVFEVIPSGTPLVLYGRLPLQYITDVKEGLPVLISPSTSSSRNDKPIKGTLSEIAPDSTENKDGPSYYDITIALNDDKNYATRVKSGLEAQASIVLGKRSVLEYFLDPIFRTLRQSLSEV